MIINRSSRFKRVFKKQPIHIQDDFIDKISIFAQNPYHPKLHTHKLKGRLAEYHAFYLRDGFRVFFEFTGKNEVNLLSIGPHGYYKRWGR